MEQQYDKKILQEVRNSRTTLEINEFKDIPTIINLLKQKGNLPIGELINIIEKSSSILVNEPTLLKIKSPIVIIGDVHGQFFDLLNIFQKFGWPPAVSYLFLGDYVDRGKFCIEVITLLLIMKCLYPKQIQLLRGNHEARAMTTIFNFKTECETKYNSDMYERFLELFMKLPLCAIIDSKYFAVHGGISPKLNNLYQIQLINRFVDIQENLPITDLMWSDPSDNRSDFWAFNKARCCSYMFSPLQSQMFLKNNSLKLIIRGHEVTAKGYKYQYGYARAPLCLTIFSAPNYCDSYHNLAVGAIIKGDSLSIVSFKEVQHPFVLDNYMNVFQFSLPILASQVTKIFKSIIKTKYLTKTAHQLSSQVTEQLKTIQTLEKINITTSQHQLLVKQFLFGHLQRQNQEKQPQKTDADLKCNNQNQLSQQMLMKFIMMKIKDKGEKMPFIFGPKNIEFIRIKQKQVIDFIQVEQLQ